jgi:uncharacterized protein
MINIIRNLRAHLNALPSETFSDAESAYIESLLDSPMAARQAFFGLNANEVLSQSEQADLSAATNRLIDHRGMRPHTFLILKATRLCNLRCTYCNSWRDGPNQTMPFLIYASAIADTLRCSSVKRLDVVWHGGEVTLLPIDYFKKAIWVQEHFRSADQFIFNSLQTNATRLTDEWIEFFQQFQIAVGVSIDGPPDLHDAKRIYASGRGSWKDVESGIGKLRAAGIEFGGLAVVTRSVVERGGREFLQYLVDLGLKGVALLNVIPDNSASLADRENYLPWDEFVAFMQQLFSIWWTDFRDKIVVRELASLVDSVRNSKPTICEFAGNCMGQFLTIDPNGDVSACDKYIGDDKHMFGNLVGLELPRLLKQSENLANAQKTSLAGIRSMRDCEYFKYCNGGCPHDVRLNQMHVPGWKSNCCGMSSLLHDVASAIITS